MLVLVLLSYAVLLHILGENEPHSARRKLIMFRTNVIGIRRIFASDYSQHTQPKLCQQLCSISETFRFSFGFMTRFLSWAPV